MRELYPRDPPLHAVRRMQVAAGMLLLIAALTGWLFLMILFPLTWLFLLGIYCGFPLGIAGIIVLVSGLKAPDS